jgi:predicted metal-binding protein
MEVLAKRERRRGQVRALYEVTVAEVRCRNNCKQTVSVKIRQENLWGLLWGLKEEERGIEAK